MKKTNLFEKLCYEKFQKAGNNYYLIKQEAFLLGISVESFLNIVYRYIMENVNKPEYVKLLDILSELETKEEIIKYCTLFKIDYKYLYNNLLPYFIYYRPHIYYLNNNSYSKLKDKIKIYEDYEYRRLDPLNTEVIIDDNYAINIVKEFNESPYSFNRFCFNKGITSVIFKNYIKIAKKCDPETYNNFLFISNLKDENKENNIQNDVIKILNNIKENSEFSIIDFCLATNFDVLELVSAADNIINDLNDLKLFRMTLKSFRNIDCVKPNRLKKFYETNYTFNINNELKEVSIDDKNTIFNFLIDNNIPICNESFKDSFIKLDKIANKKMINLMK